MMIVASKSDATEPTMSHFSAAVRNAVRYADPISWTVATAVAKALAGMLETIEPMRSSIGLIAMSDDGPAQAIAAVAEASAAGFSSPMRYPAANPGSLAGVACITQELHGPTMNLIMPVDFALPIGLHLAGAWLQRRVTPLVILLACRRVGPERNEARCLLLASDTIETCKGEPLSSTHSEWLLCSQPR
jgi:hypothetical protein